MDATRDRIMTDETDEEDADCMRRLLHGMGEPLSLGQVLSKSAELMGVRAHSEVEELLGELVLEAGGEGPALPHLGAQLGDLHRMLRTGPHGEAPCRPRSPASNLLRQIAAAIRAEMPEEPEDPRETEFEGVKAFVKLAAEAARATGEVPAGADPREAALSLIHRAARERGLLG